MEEMERMEEGGKVLEYVRLEQIVRSDIYSVKAYRLFYRIREKYIDTVIENKELIEGCERDLIVNVIEETIEEDFLDKEGQIDNGEEAEVVAVLKEDTEKAIHEIIL